MLCVISTMDGAVVVAQVPQQFQDLRLHGDVQGRGRLVGHDQARVQGQRGRNHDALLLPAGELVRVVVDPVLRIRDAHLAQGLDGPRLGFLGATPARRARARMPSAICQPTVKTGFSAVDGSWNTMATSRPRISPQLAGADADDVVAVDQHRAVG